MHKPILTAVLAFMLLFAALTIAVIAKHGPDPLTVLSLGIIAMVVFGVVGAMRQPPEE